MGFFDRIAEERIRDAIAAGELDRLPGLGKPLVLDDDARVAPELRAAYRIMKNAGVLPEELEVHQEIASLQRLLAACRDDAGEARALEERLGALELRRMVLFERRTGRHVPRGYRGAFARRLGP